MPLAASSEEGLLWFKVGKEPSMSSQKRFPLFTSQAPATAFVSSGLDPSSLPPLTPPCTQPLTEHVACEVLCGIRCGIRCECLQSHTNLRDSTGTARNALVQDAFGPCWFSICRMVVRAVSKWGSCPLIPALCSFLAWSM